jgi:nitronate monooxygenase|tara:strand:- start:180285 stop:181169 length:885 start_codon:yes stop_codon:yes gene_type:complete
MRTHTTQPFAINLWVSDYDASMRDLSQKEFSQRAAGYRSLYDKLSVAPPEWIPSSKALYERQVEAVLRARPKVFSFVFGIPSKEILSECRQRGIVTVGAATTIEEALMVEAAGVDVVLVSGFEAGGHRPSFIERAEDSLVGSFALIPAIRDQVKIPIIAAGGITDGRGMRAALALGADAVQIGTAFLACKESGASSTHQEQLRKNTKGDTRLSRAYTGRLARFINNAFIDSFENEAQEPLPFPAHSWLTTPIKQAATEQSNTDCMALYAGQGVPLVRRQTARELMVHLIEAWGG